MGGVGGVMDIGAAWGAFEVVGATWGMEEVSEAGDEGAIKGRAV
jgi:hypothetical protein